MKYFEEGDVLENENGVFRVALDTSSQGGCTRCDHEPFRCSNINCAHTRNGGKGFILLTELNYITHRLTK